MRETNRHYSMNVVHTLEYEKLKWIHIEFGVHHNWRHGLKGEAGFSWELREPFANFRTGAPICIKNTGLDSKD